MGRFFLVENFFVGWVAIGVSPTVIFSGYANFLGRVAIGKSPTLLSGESRGGKERAISSNPFLLISFLSIVRDLFSTNPKYRWLTKAILGLALLKWASPLCRRGMTCFAEHNMLQISHRA